jgi:preprotein translocase subunit SecE
MLGVRIPPGLPYISPIMQTTGKLVMVNKLEQGLGRVKETWNKIKTFFIEVNAEVRKVTWPTFKEVRDTTIVVIIAVFLFGVFLYFVDMALHRLIEHLFKVVA